jgi:hypothetical protein
MNNQKFVLCIPAGGINDMITQIKYCLDYCEVSGRVCIIDTKRVFEFENDIFEFFDISHRQLSAVSLPEFYHYISNTPGVSIFPPIIARDILFNLNTAIKWDKFQKCLTFNGIPTKLDLTRDNIESVLIHYNVGGGICASWFLTNFRPKPIILNELKRRVSVLGETYLGIHIRNTDYKSDVSGFLFKHDTILRDAPIVFLATDDPLTLLNIRKIYGEKIKSFSNLFTTSPGHAQHYIRGKPPSFVIDAFCDLILLGLSTTFIHSASPSGYSKNARALQCDPEFREFYRLLLAETE